MACGLPPPLSAIDTLALRAPVLVGLNLSVIVQLFPASTDVPQLLLSMKSPGLLPPRVIPLIARVVLPTLVSVTVLGVLVVPTFVAGKATLVADNLTSVPTPVKLMVWGLSLALSVIVTLPVRVPMAVGVKVTAMVQLRPIRTELPQVLVSLKSPLAAILVILRVAVPVLVRVTFWPALVVCRTWAAKVRLVLDKCTFGAGRVVVIATVSTAKSVQVVAQVVRLNTAEVMFGPV